MRRFDPQNLSDDNYTDSGIPAEQLGYSYKIVVPVHRNRSIETTGWLEAGNGTRLLQFAARTHGYNDCQCNDAWWVLRLPCAHARSLASLTGNFPLAFGREQA
jgi:hypothetical protein